MALGVAPTSISVQAPLASVRGRVELAEKPRLTLWRVLTTCRAVSADPLYAGWRGKELTLDSNASKLGNEAIPPHP